MSDFPHTPPRFSATFTPAVNAEIRRAAASGIYDIRGGGTKRHLPHFDDLLFLGASISRYPLEGYREKCATDVWLGTRFAKNPIHLDIPVTIAGMSKALGVTPSLLSIVVLVAGLWLLYLAVRAFIRRSIIAGVIWLVLGLWLLGGLIG